MNLLKGRYQCGDVLSVHRGKLDIVKTAPTKTECGSHAIMVTQSKMIVSL